MGVNVNVTTRIHGMDQLNRGLDTIGNKIETVGKKADKTALSAAALSTKLNMIGQRISKVGSLLTIGLTLPLGVAAGALVKLASDAQETENLFEVSMGNMGDAAREFTSSLRRELGLNEVELKKQIGTIFQMTTSMGVARDAAYPAYSRHGVVFQPRSGGVVPKAAVGYFRRSGTVAAIGC